MNSIKSWNKVIFIALVVGFVLRLTFFFTLAPRDIWQTTDPQNWLYIFKSFWMGLRFDLSAISYLTLFFWLTSLILPLNWSKRVWVFLLSFWSFLLIIDIGYYSFYNDRINILVFGFFEDDTWALVKTMWKNYPVFWILFFSLALYLLYNRIIRNFPKTALKWKPRLIIFIILFITARGTLTLFPLGPQDTVVSTIPFLNILSYGTAHSFSRAVQLKIKQKKMGSVAWNVNMKEFGYENQEDQAFIDYFEKEIPQGESRFTLMKHRTNDNILLKNKRPHIILYVMESWGIYGLQFSDPQFDLVGKLKEKFETEAITFHMQSATAGTAGSLSCLLSGLPQRAISPFLTESDYLNIQFSTSPALLYKKHGYLAQFIYGGNPGWRDINKFAYRQGFDFVLGEVDVDKKFAELDIKTSGKHEWGIYDEDLFKYAEVLLTEATSPQLLVIMTTSNHPPYSLPATYSKPDLKIENFPEKNQLIDLKLGLKRFETFRYSSDKLFESIGRLEALHSEKKIGSFVVAATADHSFWMKNFSNEELYLKNSVPFYLQTSKDLKSLVSIEQKQIFSRLYTSHQDIWPTLYNLSLFNVEYESFGNDLLQTKQPHYAITPDRLVFTKDKTIFVNQEISKNDPFAKKYRSLMSCLDSYMHQSRINQQNPSKE